MRNVWVNIFLLSVLALVDLAFSQEELKIVTYYPSPYGEYKEIRADQMSVGSGYRSSGLVDGAFVVEKYLSIASVATPAYDDKTRLWVRGGISNLLKVEDDNSVQLFLIKNDGTIELGNNPKIKLDPGAGNNNKIQIIGIDDYSGQGWSPLVINDNGFVRKGSWSQSNPSSRRYKTNIQPLRVQAESVFGLQPVRFNWKDDGRQDIGLVAEDVEGLVKDLVVYKDGKPEAVKYDKLALYLLLVIKEQQKQIQELKREIFQLKKR